LLAIWKRNEKVASTSRLRLLSGESLDMAWVVRFAHQPHLVEEGGKNGGAHDRAAQQPFCYASRAPRPGLARQARRAGKCGDSPRRTRTCRRSAPHQSRARACAGWSSPDCLVCAPLIGPNAGHCG
jgi:hypothetical protein